LPKEGIGYIVPQRVDITENMDNVSLFMRVKHVYHNAILSVKLDGREIMRIKQRHLAPGEMTRIDVKKALLSDAGNTLSVEVVREEAS